MNVGDHALVDAFWGAVFIAVFGVGGWLVVRLISGVDKRQDETAAEVKDHTKQLSDHETRITVIERNDVDSAFKKRGL